MHVFAEKLKIHPRVDTLAKLNRQWDSPLSDYPLKYLLDVTPPHLAHELWPPPPPDEEDDQLAPLFGSQDEFDEFRDHFSIWYKARPAPAPDPCPDGYRIMLGNSTEADRYILSRLCALYVTARIKVKDTIEGCFALLNSTEQPLYLWFTYHAHNLRSLEVPSAAADGEES
jgi:hypothetical protein